MATSTVTTNVRNSDTVTSGNDTRVEFPTPVKKIWVRCDTGSATSLRVAIANVNAPHIHSGSEYMLLAATETHEFSASDKNKIKVLTLTPNTAATVTYSYGVKES